MENVERIRQELRRYEHPLFDFKAEPATGGVAVTVSVKPELQVSVHQYHQNLKRKPANLFVGRNFERAVRRELRDQLCPL